MNTITQKNEHIGDVCAEAQREINVLVDTVEDRLELLFGNGELRHVDLDDMHTTLLDDVADTVHDAESQLHTQKLSLASDVNTQTRVYPQTRLVGAVSRSVDFLCDFFDASPYVDRKTIHSDGNATSDTTVRTSRCLFAAGYYLLRELFQSKDR